MASDWQQRVIDPPARYRPQPQWVWNGQLDPARLETMLDGFAATGCGGVFVCARTGLVEPYLGAEWFAAWKAAVAGARRRGLSCNIYDEFICPSGFAGGNTVDRDPAAAASVLRLLPADAPLAGGEVVARLDAAGRRLADGDVAAAARLLVLQDLPPLPGQGGQPPVDLTRPETAAAFIAATHEGYRDATPDAFGTTTSLAFTDEPSLPRPKDGVVYSSRIEDAYRRDHGRELREEVHLLFVDEPAAGAVRHDYLRSLDREVRANFFAAVAGWCEEHGLALTGHVNEHHWPDPHGMPSAMAALRHFQLPGTDLLGFQWFPDRPREMRCRMALLNQRELDSVARQCARAGALCESNGGGGYQFGPREMKPLEDLLLATGVTLLDPHISDLSLAGAAKFDWPQTISDHAPWWGVYRRHNDHTARVLAALDGGTVERRVLVLQPTSSAWVGWRAGGGEQPAIAQLRDSQLDLIDALEAGQVDYDLGDELMLAELGGVDGEGFVLGACRYLTLVLPVGCSNLLGSTVPLLERWLAAGGRICARSVPSTVEGRPSEAPAALAAHPGWIACADDETLVAELRRRHPPQLSGPGGAALPPGMLWRLVDHGDERILFCCNPWSEPWSAQLRLPGRRCREIDTGDGSLRPLPSQADGDGQLLAIELPPSGHLLCCLDDAEADRVEAEPAWRELELQPLGVEPVGPNVLSLDYATLEVGERRWEDRSTVQLDRELWQAMGFGDDPWFSGKPLGEAYRQLPLPDRGFRLEYQLAIDPALDRGSLALLVERPWLYRIVIDGQELDQSAAEACFDPEWRRIPCGELLDGEAHRVALIAERLHILHVPMPIHLLGDFGCEACARGFRAVPPRALNLGDWTRQGRSFDPWGLRYRYRFTAPVAGRCELSLPSWAGSAVELELDGQPMPPVILDHDRSLGPVIPAGEHALLCTVRGHLSNLLGPHHGEGLPGRWTWIHTPEQQPPGEAYRRWPSGLREHPCLRLLVD